MRRALALAAAAALLAACAPAAPDQAAASSVANAQSQQVAFPALNGTVVDEAGLLSVDEERRFAEASERLEREIGPQFAIATIPSLHGLSIEEYGIRLARTWRLGSRERNDGVLFLIAPNERQARIEVGYGLERRLTDPYAAKVLREQVIPRFRQGELPAGIRAGSDAIIARLRSRQSDQQIAEEDGLVI